MWLVTAAPMKWLIIYVNCCKLISRWQSFTSLQIGLHFQSVYLSVCKQYYSHVINHKAGILTLHHNAYDISPVLIDIHGFLSLYKCHYNISRLTFKCLHDFAPQQKNVSTYQPERHLRSAIKGLFEEHSFKLETYGRHAHFAVAIIFWY